ncbi:alpha/beta hydrolase (plasmid) [Rhodococcus sp. DMU1]|nr:alpha/beta hydrolase [Rhodococcus sp. DMU1]
MGPSSTGAGRRGDPLPARRWLRDGLDGDGSPIAADLAAWAGRPVRVLDYPLAPETTFPEQPRAAARTWAWLLDQVGDVHDLVIAGDSAGAPSPSPPCCCCANSTTHCRPRASCCRHCSTCAWTIRHSIRRLPTTPNCPAGCSAGCARATWAA